MLILFTIITTIAALVMVVSFCMWYTVFITNSQTFIIYLPQLRRFRRILLNEKQLLTTYGISSLITILFYWIVFIMY